MNPSIIKISLDLNKHGSQIQIPMFRGDTKRIIQVSFTQNGVPYILSECNVAFTATKPDGTFLNCTCDVDENKNIAIYDLDKDNGDSDNHKQTTAVEGKVECQFVISSVEVVDGETVDHKIASAEFDVLVMKTIYNEEDILNSEVALGALAQYYVPVSRNIAGVDLTDNISTEELGEELLEFFSIHKNGAPPVCSTGTYFIGQRWIDTMRNDIYVLRTIVKNHYGEGIHNYQWEKIAKHSELSDYVQKTRTIAGLSLNNDITAEELRTALDVKGKIIIHSTLPPTNDLETVAEVGDFWLISKDQSLYVCYGKQATENGYANYLWLSLTDYLKDDTTLAELRLKNNITADELKGALEVSTIGTLFNPPTPNTVGEYRQLVCVGDNTKFTDLYLCLGKQTDGTYKWVEIAPSGNGDVDLSGYVPTSRKIANYELSADITVENLLFALKAYPVILTNGAPKSSTIGHKSQLCVATIDNVPTLYFCRGDIYNTDTGTTSFDWQRIFDSQLELQDYVPTTRKIADVDLADDITTEELYDALQIKPHTVDYLPPTSETKGAIGQLYMSLQTKRVYVCTDSSYTGEDMSYVWVELTNPDIANELEFNEEGKLTNGDKVASVECVYDLFTTYDNNILAILGGDENVE